MNGQETLPTDFAAGMLHHEHYMGLALEQARLAYTHDEVPVGAILVSGDGKILSRAHNAPITLNDPTAHAEVLALRKGAEVVGNYRLTGCLLYVTLEPCVMCLGALLHARVGTLVFGTPDPRTGAAGSVVDLTRVPDFNHYIEVVRGIREEECAGMLRLFFRERRHKAS